MSFDDRSHPRLWHYDYLLLRPLARDLRTSIESAQRELRVQRVLDVGSGGSPYRDWFGATVTRYECLDLDKNHHPSVVARGDAIPFADETFDAVLSTQAMSFVADPKEAGAEMARVLRPGGRLWLSSPGAWPYDSAEPEQRFTQRDLPELVPRLRVIVLLPQGGLLTLPFSLLNVCVREFVIATEEKLGPLGRFVRLPAMALYVISNLTGSALEGLARRGPLSRFLGYLHCRMPMNFLIVAEKPA